MKNWPIPFCVFQIREVREVPVSSFQVRREPLQTWWVSASTCPTFCCCWRSLLQSFCSCCWMVTTSRSPTLRGLAELQSSCHTLAPRRPLVTCNRPGSCSNADARQDSLKQQQQREKENKNKRLIKFSAPSATDDHCSLFNCKQGRASLIK